MPCRALARRVSGTGTAVSPAAVAALRLGQVSEDVRSAAVASLAFGLRMPNVDTVHYEDDEEEHSATLAAVLAAIALDEDEAAGLGRLAI